MKERRTHIKRFRGGRLFSTTLPQTRQLLPGPCSGGGGGRRVIVLVHGSRSSSTDSRGRRRRRSGNGRRRRGGRDGGLLLLLGGHDMRLVLLRLVLLRLLMFKMRRGVGGRSSHGGDGRRVLMEFRHCQDQQVFLSGSWERNQPGGKEGREGGRDRGMRSRKE